MLLYESASNYKTPHVRRLIYFSNVLLTAEVFYPLYTCGVLVLIPSIKVLLLQFDIFVIFLINRTYDVTCLLSALLYTVSPVVKYYDTTLFLGLGWCVDFFTCSQSLP